MGKVPPADLSDISSQMLSVIQQHKLKDTLILRTFRMGRAHPAAAARPPSPRVQLQRPAAADPPDSWANIGVLSPCRGGERPPPHIPEPHFESTLDHTCTPLQINTRKT